MTAAIQDRPIVHGTPAGYTKGRCREACCREAHAAAERDRTRLIAYGRWRPFVPAGPVRAHVLTLIAGPETYRSIAARAGVASAAVARLLYGRDGRAASKVRSETADALLALQPQPTASMIDGTGTSRRANALLALGYPYSVQADESGTHPRFYNWAIKQGRVSVRFAAKVAAVYDRLSGTPAPDTADARKARSRAAQRGFPPPLAWDDDIDDPAAAPTGVPTDTATSPRVLLALDDVDEIAVARLVEGERGMWGRLNHAERRAAVAELLTRPGWSKTRIGRWLGQSGSTIAAYMPCEEAAA